MAYDENICGFSLNLLFCELDNSWEMKWYNLIRKYKNQVMQIKQIFQVTLGLASWSYWMQA